MCVWRVPKGGACGQLALDHTDRSHVGTRGGVGDIEDLISGTTTKRGVGGGGKGVRRRVGVKRRLGSQAHNSEDDSSEDEDEEVKQEEEAGAGVENSRSVTMPRVSCNQTTWLMSSGLGVIVAVLVALAGTDTLKTYFI